MLVRIGADGLRRGVQGVWRCVQDDRGRLRCFLLVARGGLGDHRGLGAELLFPGRARAQRRREREDVRPQLRLLALCRCDSLLQEEQRLRRGCVRRGRPGLGFF